MSDQSDAADKAFAHAEHLIEQARVDGDTKLDLSVKECHALTRLPDGITQLTNLETLYLSNTQITDLAPIAQMTAMTRLILEGTQIADLAHLERLTQLKTLTFYNTQIADLAPLTQMTMMRTLGLGGTQVTDLTPIAQMTEMTNLYLGDTLVADLTPITQMAKVKWLDISDTQVADLTPILQLLEIEWLELGNTLVSDLRQLRVLETLKENPSFRGLTFQNTPATRSDPRLAEIADIEDPKDRATQLFDYLDTLPPWPEPLPWHTPSAMPKTTAPEDLDPDSTPRVLVLHNRLDLDAAPPRRTT